MAGAKRVNWSPEAERDFLGILNYLLENWPSSIADHFIDQISDSIHLIQVRPTLYPVINKSFGIRRCVVTRHNSLFFRIIDEAIEILRIFDTRQDPEKLRF